jgi:hypothetical protein
VALLFWGWVMGALGALLAIPLTLLVKVLLIDVDPRGHWLDALLREEPRAPRTMRARRRMNARRAALASVRKLHHHPRRPASDPAEAEVAGGAAVGAAGGVADAPVVDAPVGGTGEPGAR